MAVLTTIDGIPLYTTLEEAIYWASLNGLEGYHTHQYQGQTGYMGGVNHGNVIGQNVSQQQTPTPPVAPPVPPMNEQTAPPASQMPQSNIYTGSTGNTGGSGSTGSY